MYAWQGFVCRSSFENGFCSCSAVTFWCAEVGGKNCAATFTAFLGGSAGSAEKCSMRCSICDTKPGTCSEYAGQGYAFPHPPLLAVVSSHQSVT